MAKVSELEQFAQNFCSRYCLTCPDNCCNGTRHLINISKYDEKAVQLFLSRQVPLFEKETLDRDSVIYWLCKGTMSAYQEFLNRQKNTQNRQINPAHFTGDILLSDKTKVPRPALIETPLVSVINGELTTNNMYYYVRN